jgi:transposase
MGGRRVRVVVAVRRFRCQSPSCPAVTFAEQIPGLTTPFARYTPVAAASLLHIALSLAGRAGARLAETLGFAAGRDTLLRLIRAQKPPAPAPVMVLGVDDFAIRRGHVYATVLIDMDTHQPVDVLPDRDAATLAAWLADHPEVEVICRDRAGAYAEGARTGAPQAIQVADRFHLWQNLCEAVDKTVAAHHRCLPEPPPPSPPDEDEPAPQIPDAPNPAGEPDCPERPEGLLAARVRGQHPYIRRLVEQGMSISAISRLLDLDRKTVRRYARTDLDDLLSTALERVSILDGFKEHLHRRWAQGCTNATVLQREIEQLGYTGSVKTLRRYLQRFREGRHAPAAGPVPPKPRQVTRWITTHPDRVEPDDAVRLKQIHQRCPELEATSRLVAWFATMMTDRTGTEQLSDWLEAAAASGLPAFASFAAGIRKDLAAVTHGLSLPHSSGAVEGNVNRIKMLKRQMYGRAKLDLLRLRILLTP